MKENQQSTKTNPCGALRAHEPPTMPTGAGMDSDDDEYIITGFQLHQLQEYVDLDFICQAIRSKPLSSLSQYDPNDELCQTFRKEHDAEITNNLLDELLEFAEDQIKRSKETSNGPAAIFRQLIVRLFIEKFKDMKIPDPLVGRGTPSHISGKRGSVRKTTGRVSKK